MLGGRGQSASQPMRRLRLLDPGSALRHAGPLVRDPGIVQRQPLLRHHDRGAEADTTVEVGDIGVQHPEAAIGDEASDRARRVGAVDRVFATGSA